MSDVLSRILAGMMSGGAPGGGGGGSTGGGFGGGYDGGYGGGGSPLGDPQLRRGERPQYDRSGGPPQYDRSGGGAPMQAPGGGMADILGGAMGGGGLGGILGGLLGGMAGGGMPGGGMPGGGMPRHPAPREAPAQAGGGGLGDLLGGLGGMKGVAMMALLAYMMRGRGGTQGLASLTDQLRGAGLGETVDSWVGPGGNRELRPQELARAIPPDALDEIERRTGLGRDEVLSELSRGLPGMVDKLTPRGRMPERDDDLNDIDERDVLGSFGIGPVPGAAYGKHAPGQGGGRKY